jgi:chemotaxis protein histidine kinase CheA
MNMQLKHDNLKSVERLLNAPHGVEEQFLQAGKCLAELVEAGQLSQCHELADSASLLKSLCELADLNNVEEPFCPQAEVIEFLQRHLFTVQSILDDPLDSHSFSEKDSVEQMKTEARDRWGEWLALIESNSGASQVESGWDGWEDAAPETETALPHSNRASLESSDPVADRNSQVELMLAALGSTCRELPTSNVHAENHLAETSAEASQQFQPHSSPPTSDAAFIAVDANDSRELANDQGLLEAYLDDAYRCLQSMEQAVLALENATDDPQPLQQFCRELHTLKGASASVGLSKLATYLHEVESEAERWSASDHEHEIQVDALLQAVDAVRSQVAALSKKPEASPVLAEQKSIQSARPVKKDPELPRADLASFQTGSETSIRIRASQLDRLMDMLAELVVLRNRRENHVNELHQLNDELSRCATRLQFAEDQPQSHNLDALAAYSGSNTLSEVSKDITEISRNLRDLHKPVSVDNQAISKFIRHFRQELMQLRRLPISGLFKRLQRAARDAANSEEKQVQVKVLGDDNGLEQEIQEQLYEPLLHMVRNAVSHGIESSQRRTKIGKNSIGTITLSAKSNANLLVIEVRDDGGGIDFEAVRRRAIDRGLLSTDHQASIHELSQLIFHPGFSTREEATEISGRGFGMDIVATTVAQMHGRIEVDSTPGQGSTMRLLIPLRSGIEHIMVLRASGQLFGLPMQSVSAAKRSSLLQRDTVQVSLSKLLSLPGNDAPQDENVLILRQKIGLMTANSFSVEGRPETECGKSRFALTVDEVVGPEEVVVRSLPGLVQHHPLFCGVTLSGAGEMVLLLNSERLGQAGLQSLHDSHSTRFSDLSPQQVESDKRPSALVVDDSLSARKSLVKKLAQHGFCITEAGDGLEALEQMRRKEFAIVLTDLDMPRLGGLELLADIQTGHYGSAQVVVVSSRNEEEFRSRALASGAAAYLTKPVTDKSLADLMSNLDLVLTYS